MSTILAASGGFSRELFQNGERPDDPVELSGLRRSANRKLLRWLPARVGNQPCLRILFGQSCVRLNSLTFQTAPLPKITMPCVESGVFGQGKGVQDAFAKIFLAANAPRNAAMFRRRSDDLETYDYYFSPDAAAIASILLEINGAVRCQASAA